MTKETTRIVEVEIEEQVAEAVETPTAEGAKDTTDAARPDDAGEELVVSIGDEEPESDPAAAPDAPAWVKKVRSINKQVVKENRELKRKLDELSATSPAATASAPQMPEEPELENFDYDTDRFKEAHRAWAKEVAKIERDAEDAARQRKAAEEADRTAWAAQLAKHQKAGKDLPVADYEDAESSVFTVLDQTQRGIIINYADNSALLVYGLKGNPAKLQSLADIKDPGRFIKAMTLLETQLKTSKRRPTTLPETRVAHSATGKSTNSGAELDKLRAQAAITGDYTPVMKYKAKLRAEAK